MYHCVPPNTNFEGVSAVELIVMRRAETNPAEPTTPPILSPEGLDQIDGVVKAIGTDRLEAIVSSEMSRALATAEELVNRSGAPLIRQDGLQERNFGDWNTWDWPSVAAQLELLSLQERFTFVPPNGESWQQMERRLRKAIDEVATLPYNTVLVVTHWGPIRVLSSILNSQPRESTLQLEVANGECFRFDLGR